ncbi:MAG: polymerase, sigma 32 subunit, RpoH [Solirubrobacterales bacterium]|nr:polymerase, sigma 32 subunit, RpoH [Solirubrobacterales bacterium]
MRRFTCRHADSVCAGDIVGLDTGSVALGQHGDRGLLGAVTGCVTGESSTLQLDVVVDPDAVYAVADSEPRVAGTQLALTGATGAQGLGTPERRGELVVVVDCSPEDETLVRLRFDCHHEVVVRSSGRGTHLSPTRERTLVLAAAAGDPEACAQLVKSFIPAISGIARLYRGAVAVDRQELIQAGVVGLLEAIKRFDSELGTPLWAYASWWVRQGMQGLVAELGRSVVLSDRAARGLARVRYARADFVRAERREPTSDELVRAAGLPRAQVERLLAAEYVPRGFDEPLGEDEGATTVGERLADPGAEEAYDRVLARLEIDQVRDLTATLTEREREIVFDHYGLERSPRTLREIGDRLGISAERVRQIEEGSLRKLREAVLSPPVSP